MKYYEIQSWHGNVLATEDNYLVSAKDCASVSSAIIAFVPDSKNNVIFLMSSNDQSYGIRVLPGNSKTSCLAFYIENINNGEIATLYHVQLNKFLCSPPIQNNNEKEYLVCDRRVAREWESFRLVLKDENDLHPLILDKTQQINDLLKIGINRTTIASLLSGLKEDNLFLLEALFPFLTISDLRMVGEVLFTSRNLVSSMSALFPDDPWLVNGIANLKLWDDSRNLVTDAGDKEATRLYRLSNQLFLNKGFDDVFQKSTEKVIDSLWHGCNTSLRSSMVPRRNACIVASVRNEGLYLVEWLAYHRAIGIQEFFIFCNDNDDGSDRLLNLLAEEQIITLLNNQMRGKSISPQLKAYDYAFSFLPDVLDCKWSFVLDIDEYFVFNNRVFGGVDDYLAWHEYYEVDAIACNWVNIGPSRQVCWNNELLTKRFTQQLSVDRHIKSVFRPSKFCSSTCHFPVSNFNRPFVFKDSTRNPHTYKRSPDAGELAPSYSDVPNDHFACVFHYFWKSAEELLVKACRNSGGEAVNSGLLCNPRAGFMISTFMDNFNPSSFAEDDRINQCAPGFENELSKILSINGISSCINEIVDTYKSRVNWIKTSIETGMNIKADARISSFLELVCRR